jgi:hypothetical protein
MTIDVTAPVSGGGLRVTADEVRLTLRLALDQLRTGNFLVQAAARSLVTKYDAHVLSFDGSGSNETGIWQVSGHARAGTVDVQMALTVTACGPTHDPMAEIELVGAASMGTVHLPLPGMGTVDDFSFDVDARLAMSTNPNPTSTPTPPPA